ncbi:MAG: hypothetical protein ACLQFM_04255, partial [Terriglobales bacterium]
PKKKKLIFRRISLQGRFARLMVAVGFSFHRALVAGGARWRCPDRLLIISSRGLRGCDGGTGNL